MSNFLAPAVVTETLRHLLTEAATRAVPGAQVTLGRPQALTNGSQEAGVNIFAYQVSPNDAFANADLPTRSSSGAFTRRPQIGLNIHYLLSFRGPESDLVPELLLGSCVGWLHAQPILTRELIERVIHPPEPNGPHPILQDADLGGQVEKVKITPLPLNLEELSKLWSVFFQVPYVLSVAYQASVVLIEEEIEPAAPGLPVRERRIFVQPFRRIRVGGVESSAGPSEPMHADSTIRIVGSGLSGENVAVVIAGEVVAPTRVTEGEIMVDLSGLTNPRAGILPLYVVDSVAEDAPHLRFESNVVPLTLAPRIRLESVIFTAGDDENPDRVSMESFPEVVVGQRVKLFLNELTETNTAPNAYVFAHVFDEPPAEEDLNISVPVRNVAPGTYLVRIQVDGAESALQVDDNEESDTFGRYIGPAVVVT